MSGPLSPAAPRSYGGKPAEARRMDRRERWIDAGLELFGTVGFRGTSLRALARESGIAERYFAENFADLDDLFVAVHQRLHHQLAGAVTRAVRAAGPDLGERARLGLRALVDGFADDPRCARIKLAEYAVAGPRAMAAMRASQRQVAVLLIGGVEATALPDGTDLEVLGLGLAGGVFELITNWHTGRLTLSRDELVEHCALLITAVHRGLTRPEE